MRIPGRFAPRRPDESPTRLGRNQLPRPSVFDVSAQDPVDRFRPANCPQCRIHPSGPQQKGYLCRLCEYNVFPDTWYTFKTAAARVCAGPCGGQLSEEDRLGQRFICRPCARGQDRQIQTQADFGLVSQIQFRAFRKLNKNFSKKLRLDLVHVGRCMNMGCRKPMAYSDFYVPNIQPGLRYVNCMGCRHQFMQFDPSQASMCTSLPLRPRPDRIETALPRLRTLEMQQNMGSDFDGSSVSTIRLPTTSPAPVEKERVREVPSVFDSDSTIAADISHRFGMSMTRFLAYRDSIDTENLEKREDLGSGPSSTYYANSGSTYISLDGEDTDIYDVSPCSPQPLPQPPQPPKHLDLRRYSL